MHDKNQVIIIDEAGDNILPTKGEQSIYTINALLLNPEKYNEFESIAKNIVIKFAGKGELKSSKIGNNLKKRQAVLSAIAEAKIPFYCLVVSKERIYADSGLRFKPVFYKTLHRMFYSSLKRSFHNLEIISDCYGTERFMDSFIGYIEEREGLFCKIKFLHSKEAPLIQIADVIAGSVRRVYLNQDPIENLECLGYPSIPIEEWPPNISRFMEEADGNKNKQFNNIIRRIALTAATDFVYEHIDDDENDELRCLAEAARYLISRYYRDPSEFVHKSEISKHLKSFGFRFSSREGLSKLRKNGLIISSTEQGVKIPYDSSDMQKWVERVNSQVVPYLKRFEKARNAMLLASRGEYEIVDSTLYPELLKYITKQKI